MVEGEAISSLVAILHLEPGYGDQLHPYALEQYLRFLAENREELEKGQFTAEELNSFLSDEERAELDTCGREIAEWLLKCRKDSGEASLSRWPYSSPSYSISKFKTLLRTAVERKVKKARQETEKKKRLEALEAIAPPLDDAKKYLSDHEYQQFCDSVPGAIDAYLGRDKRADSFSPRIWLLNSKASDYLLWTSVIEERKESEARREQAQLEHDKFIKEINDSVRKLKQELGKEKKPSFAYPPALAQYHPETWFEPKLPTKVDVEKWVQPQISQRVPQALRNFVRWEVSWEVLSLPYAEYELLGVPCLTWCFRTLILVKVHLELAESQFTKEFQGYAYEVRGKAEDLGCFHLGPVEWDHREGFTIPLALLSLLAKGKLEGEGTEVMGVDGSSISFTVRGFAYDCTEIEEHLRRFIMDTAKDKTLAQGLLVRGLIEEVTASLVEAKWDEPLPVSGKTTEGGEPDLENVVAKLVELGWTEADAKKAVETTAFPENATTEELVKMVLEKSY